MIKLIRKDREETIEEIRVYDNESNKNRCALITTKDEPLFIDTTFIDRSFVDVGIYEEFEAETFWGKQLKSLSSENLIKIKDLEEKDQPNNIYEKQIVQNQFKIIQIKNIDNNNTARGEYLIVPNNGKLLALIFDLNVDYKNTYPNAYTLYKETVQNGSIISHPFISISTEQLDDINSRRGVYVTFYNNDGKVDRIYDYTANITKYIKQIRIIIGNAQYPEFGAGKLNLKIYGCCLSMELNNKGERTDTIQYESIGTSTWISSTTSFSLNESQQNIYYRPEPLVELNTQENLTLSLITSSQYFVTYALKPKN